MVIVITTILVLLLIRGLTILVRNFHHGVKKEAYEEELERSEHMWNNYDIRRKVGTPPIDREKERSKIYRNYFS